MSLQVSQRISSVPAATAPSSTPDRSQSSLATPGSERAQTTAQRGDRISAQLSVPASPEPRLSQLRPSANRPEPLVCQRSALNSGRSFLGKALLAGGIAAASVLTGGVAFVLISGAWLGGKLINRAVNGPLMRWIMFGDEQARKGVDREAVKTHIQAMGNTQEITVQTTSGQTMRGHFFSPASSGERGKPDITKPVVLLLTGTSGCAEVQGYELARMYSHGESQANVLSVNYRGFGESDGGLPSRESVYDDGHSMFNELLKMGFKPEQILIHGYSLGATVAAKIQESAQRQAMPLKAVVLDRPMTSVFEAAKAQMGGGLGGAIAGKLGRWGVGSMDCQAKVKALNPETAPPMLVTYDSEVLGPAAQRMGEAMQERMGDHKVSVKPTESLHLDNTQAINQLTQEYKRLLV